MKYLLESVLMTFVKFFGNIIFLLVYLNFMQFCSYSALTYDSYVYHSKILITWSRRGKKTGLKFYYKLVLMIVFEYIHIYINTFCMYNFYSKHFCFRKNEAQHFIKAQDLEICFLFVINYLYRLFQIDTPK